MNRAFRVRACPLLAVIALAMAGGGAAESSRTVWLDVPGRSDATPWIAASGPMVAVAWGASDQKGADVFVAVSRNGGAAFGPPVRVNAIPGEARLGGELPPRVALAPRPGMSSPDLVVVWTARGQATDIKTARSHDGGKTFEPPVTLQSPGAGGDRGWPAIALDGQGRAHAIWLDHRGLVMNRRQGADHPAERHRTGHDGVAMAERSGLYYAAVAQASPPERELTKGVCYCCKTALATGPDGVVSAAWRHVYPGNLRDIAFTMSRDEGRSFSAPVRVNEDGWVIEGCPDDGPAMAVDARGVVHLAWPTVVGGASPEGAIFYASTTDGRRFSAPVRVPTLGGPKPSHPQIAIDPAGRIAVAWDETIDGRRVAAAREVRPAARGASFGDVVTLSPDGPALYPVLAASSTGLVAVWTIGGDPSRVAVRRLPLP